MRPKLLDLFAGVGGAGMGYYQAGFDVVGVDIEPVTRYPFDLWVQDAMAVLRGEPIDRYDGRGKQQLDLPQFSVIHASPPCQAYADQGHRYRGVKNYPDMIPELRELLIATGIPYVIENVDTAPLRDPVLLCGTMFPELRVIRHRCFETSIYMVGPPHPRGPHPRCFTYDKRKAHYGKLDEWTAYVTITGGGNCSVEAARDAMGIRWASMRGELTQSIPPAYTRYVGLRLIEMLGLQPIDQVGWTGDAPVRPSPVSSE